MADQDFQEEDVWGVVKEREESNHKVNKPYKIKKRSPSSSSSFSVWTSHDGARRIPRSSNEGKVPHQQQQSSAPMGIPDWSKIYKEKSQGPSDGCYENGDEDDDADADDGEMVPPHEYIARRLARSHITSSMCEGVGRTLKGRDLSKLRNAILTKTGFLE